MNLHWYRGNVKAPGVALNALVVLSLFLSPMGSAAAQRPIASQPAVNAVSGVESLSGVLMAAPYSWGFTVDPGATIMDPLPPKRTSYYYNGQRVARGGLTPCPVSCIMRWSLT
jgi:hypothetical protein